MNILLPNFIVGVGGSAGGLGAYKAFLDALPSSTGMAFVIVSHLLPTAMSELALILSKRTKMPVLVASSALRIQANHVYVCPPNADLLVEGDVFKVVIPRAKRNVQINILFISLALAAGKRAVGIVFSGYDGDGAEGCRAIKAKGGTTFTQDGSAEVGDMPKSAQATGCVDFVLSPKGIADRLGKMAKASV